MTKINGYLSNSANNIVPYQWEKGVVEKALRFDTNTLPNPPKSLPTFLEDLKKKCPINEYTDPNYTKLKKLIAKYEGVKSEMLTITNSGDEAIDILAKSFLNPGDYFITTPPTYEMFDIQCTINRGINLPIPLKETTWEVNYKKLIRLSQNPRVKLIFMVNPNNPTASIISENISVEIINKSNAIVVMDEVYREFYGKSVVRLLSRYKNLIILRSFSKFAAMAGARIGYLLANPLLSQKFDAIRFPMGVSYLSYKLAEYVLTYDRKWMKDQVEIVKKERGKLIEELIKLNFYVYPSCANFLLVKIGKRANEIYRKLKEKGTVVRNLSNRKYLEGCVRITVRSPKENNQLLQALQEVL